MALPKNLNAESLRKFLGGRKRYNAQRRRVAELRRKLVLFVWESHPDWCQADLARFFQVTRTTISRDIKKLKADELIQRHPPQCPLCRGRGTLDVEGAVARVAKIISETERSFPDLL